MPHVRYSKFAFDLADQLLLVTHFTFPPQYLFKLLQFELVYLLNERLQVVLGYVVQCVVPVSVGVLPLRTFPGVVAAEIAKEHVETGFLSLVSDGIGGTQGDPSGTVVDHAVLEVDHVEGQGLRDTVHAHYVPVLSLHIEFLVLIPTLGDHGLDRGVVYVLADHLQRREVVLLQVGLHQEGGLHFEQTRQGRDLEEELVHAEGEEGDACLLHNGAHTADEVLVVEVVLVLLFDGGGRRGEGRVAQVA